MDTCATSARLDMPIPLKRWRAVAKEEQVENAVWTVLNLLEHTELIYGDLLQEVRRGQLKLSEEPFEARIRQAEQQRHDLHALLEQTRLPAVGGMEPDPSHHDEGDQ